MSLPVETLKRRPPAARCDVAVVGAGLAGLVCAATLAAAGRRVVVVDRSKRPGGRLQTVNHQGFAVDLGPVLWEAGLDSILENAGVADHGLVPLSVRDSIRVSVIGTDGPPSPPLPVPIPGAIQAPSTLDAVKRLYEVPPRLFAALGEVYEEWSSATDEQLAQWRSLEIGAWLEERSFESALAGAIRRSAVLLGGTPDASLGVLVDLARSLGSNVPTHLAVGDTPIAGARGVAQSLVDLVIEAGGEFRLGTRAIGLGIEDGRFTSLAMRREETPFIEELAAERCVFAIPPEEMRALLPAEPRAALERLLPARTPERDLCVAWGLADESGEEEGADKDQPTVIRLVAPSRAEGDDVPAAGASLVWSTRVAPRLAPPGQSLVRATQPVPAGLATDVQALDARVAALRAAFHTFAPEAADGVLWEHCWLAESDSAAALRLPSLPLLAPGLSGVLLAGQEVAVTGASAGGVTAAAFAGRAAAEKILADASAVRTAEREPEASVEGAEAPETGTS